GYATLPSEPRNGPKCHQVTISTAADTSSTHEETVETSSRPSRRMVRASVDLTPRAPADIFRIRPAATSSRLRAKRENRKITVGAMMADTPTLIQVRTDSFAKSVRPST